MTSSLEFGFKVSLQQRHGFVVGDEAGGQHDDVGVVVLPDQAGDLGNPRKARANPLVLVQGEGHALARAAESHPLGEFAALDGPGQRMGVVGVIDALG